MAGDSDNLFSTWEWADSWWRHLRCGGQPRVLAVCDAGEPVAIVPVHAERRCGARLLRIVGHGVADQLGAICGPEQIPSALLGLNAALGDSGVLLAERLPSRGPLASSIDGVEIHREASPVIDLAGHGDWEGYLGAHSSNFRQQVRRRGRRLERAGVRFRLARDEAQLAADVDALLELHHARWGPGSMAFFGRRAAFHQDFALRALRQGWLRLWLAEAEGRAVAAWYGFRFAGVEYYYQSGRDPAWDQLGVGVGILEHSIREAFADGMREYRLLRGGEPYKDRYATAQVSLSTVALATGPLRRWRLPALRALGGSARGRRLLGLEQP